MTGDTATSTVTGLVDEAVSACVAGARCALADRVEALAAVAIARGAAGVDGVLGGSLVDAVTATWRRGWQPADLPRAGRRVLGRPHARLLARAVVRAVGEHPPDAVPDRWAAQIAALDQGDRPVSAGGAPDGWVLQGRAGSGDRSAVSHQVLVAVQALVLLRRLPPLPQLGSLPGDIAATGGAVGGARSAAGARVIAKVVALLAKAESTEFGDEAESLTAKAQELMTRHAVDRASLEAHGSHGAHGEQGASAGSQVEGRRIGLDDPYAGAKALLLDAVASPNGCQAVWTKPFGFATVFGEQADLDAVEVLFTSLLVQSARSLVAEVPPGTGAASAGRTRSFRRSFLVAYAGRIGARLRAAADAVATAEAERTPSLLPVLAARRDAVEAAREAVFPHLRASTMSANDAAGWQAGEQAADRAQLDIRPAVGHGRRSLAS